MKYLKIVMKQFFPYNQYRDGEWFAVSTQLRSASLLCGQLSHGRFQLLTSSLCSLFARKSAQVFLPDKEGGGTMMELVEILMKMYTIRAIVGITILIIVILLCLFLKPE
jgi:hypothetical protein